MDANGQIKFRWVVIAFVVIVLVAFWTRGSGPEGSDYDIDSELYSSLDSSLDAP